MNITANKQGDRVELIKCRDEYTHIPPGTQGKVDLVDAIGTIHVTWDNGYHLGLVPGVDEWKTLVHHTSPRTAIVSSKELGINCWAPKRFVEEGSRCERLYLCDYPEKKNCQAIHAEITYLKNRQRELMKQSGDIDTEIEEVIKMLKK